jgi:hypothetical protein
MSCNFNNCCECCNRRAVTTSVTSNTTSLLLTIPNRTLCNGQDICVIIAQNLPTISSPLKVSVVVDSKTIPIILPNGNALYSSQVRSRRMYRLRYAGDTSMFVLESGYRCLPCANVSIPALNPPTTSTTVQSTGDTSTLDTTSASSTKES